MAIRSKEFIDIAEGIRSHELTTKRRIDGLKSKLVNLSAWQNHLLESKDFLEATIAALESADDDEVDHSQIASLYSELFELGSELDNVKAEISDSSAELEYSEGELEKVLEEKDRTLFEIEERARQTSNNISLAGGMYGAYSGVGSSLQGSLQSSLAALSSAAIILGGSSFGATGGMIGTEKGSANGGGKREIGVVAGGLSAFCGQQSTNTNPMTKQVHSSQVGLGSSSSQSVFSVSHDSLDAKQTQPTVTGQTMNYHATTAFGTMVGEEPNSAMVQSYQSTQESSTKNSFQANEALDNESIISAFIAKIFSKKNQPETNNIAPQETEVDRHMKWMQQIMVSVDPITLKSTTKNSGISGDPSVGQRQRSIHHDVEMELGIGSLGIIAAMEQFFLQKKGVPSNYEQIQSHTTNVKNQILATRLNPLATKNDWHIKKKPATLLEDLMAVNPNFYDPNGKVTNDERWRRNCQRCVVALEARCRGFDVQATERILDVNRTDTLPIMNHPTGWLSVFKNARPVNCKGLSGLATGEIAKKIMAQWGDGARAIVRIQRCDTIRVQDANGKIAIYALEEVNGKTVICDVVSRKEVDILSLYPNADFSEGFEIRTFSNPAKYGLTDYMLCAKKTNQPLAHIEKNGGHVFTAIQHEGKTIFCDSQTGKIIENQESYFLLAKREETYIVRVDNLDFTERVLDCCRPVGSIFPKAGYNDEAAASSVHISTSERERAPPI